MLERYGLLLAALFAILAVTAHRASLQKIINSVAGPFRVLVDHAEECPPAMRPKHVYYRAKWIAVRDRRKPEHWFYSGNLTSYITANDNYTLEATLASWSSRGGWVENAYKFSADRPCTQLPKIYPHYWRMAMKEVFNDPERKCPFYPGFYSVSNVSTDIEVVFPPAFFYGKYRGTGTAINTHTRELVACMRAFFTVAPKLNKARPT